MSTTRTQIEALTETGRDDEFAVERVERQLRDRVRVELGLPPAPHRADINRAEHARSLKDQPQSETRRRGKPAVADRCPAADA